MAWHLPHADSICLLIACITLGSAWFFLLSVCLRLRSSRARAHTLIERQRNGLLTAINCYNYQRFSQFHLISSETMQKHPISQQKFTSKSSNGLFYLECDLCLWSLRFLFNRHSVKFNRKHNAMIFLFSVRFICNHESQLNLHRLQSHRSDMESTIDVV